MPSKDQCSLLGNENNGEEEDQEEDVIGEVVEEVKDIGTRSKTFGLRLIDLQWALLCHSEILKI